MNEVLSSTDFTEYLSIKDTAKILEFKFVWYSDGRILVRREERKRVHVIRTAADLEVIMASLGMDNLTVIKNMSFIHSRGKP